MPARRRRPPTSPAETPAEDASLARYQAMRDFARTAEPSGQAEAGFGAPDQPLTFVVQKHRATRLHYDLRLEVDGVMPSWPIPRGPSTDPAARRLAVMTEPHPLDYATFEGVIPRGQYGAGEVIMWDRGTYSPDETGALVFQDRAEANRQMRAQIASGKVSVTLRGHRMKGSWTLVKTGQAPDSWLALKHRDDAATGVDLAEAFDNSVLSGLTIADLQAGRQVPERAAEPLLAADLPGAKRAAFLDHAMPMAATQTAQPFDREGWIFEPKIDGVRALITLRDGEVRLTSRRGLDMTAQYPSLASALARQPANTLALDGEIAALDERGVPSFELLQQRMNVQDAGAIGGFDRSVPVVCYVFDILYVDGVDVRRVPLLARKRLLERTLMPGPRVRLVEHTETRGIQAYEGAVAIGLEGLMAKRADSRYEAGSRSQAWMKVKARLTNEFVVTGYTPGLNSRASTFGALVIATRAPDGGLVSVGRVGSGFDETTLKSLRARLDALRTPKSPMMKPPPASERVTHVRPDLVVEVEYAQVTADGNLRAPVFLRLREDKAPSEVRTLHLDAPPAGARLVPTPGPDSLGETLADDVASALRQVEALGKQGAIQVGDARIAVTNLDKVMWPEHHGQRALTKRDLLAYYARMAHVLLPHLRDRPLTMTRYPNGIEGHSFYQKHVEKTPPYVETVRIFTESGGGDQDFVVVNNLPTLLWLAQYADIALHTSLARIGPEPDGHHLGRDFTGTKTNVEASLLNYPDFVLFDFDPYIYRGDEQAGGEPELNRPAYEQTVRAAQALKTLLDSAGLSSFVKTSGATGLHVYVPVLRQYDYETVRDIATTVGGLLVRAHPREVTTEWNVVKRRGLVFLDVNQNARNKNLAAPYSPRAKPGAPVSMPLRWDELERVFPTDFTILTAPDRLRDAGDLWAHILDAKHDLAGLTA